MQVVPTVAIPAQAFSILLGGQSVDITIRQLRYGLFLDLSQNGEEIVGLVICQNGNRIVRDTYLGFVGDLIFVDMTGLGQNPDYTGLGTRYQLVYLEAADLPPGVG